MNIKSKVRHTKESQISFLFNIILFFGGGGMAGNLLSFQMRLYPARQDQERCIEFSLSADARYLCRFRLNWVALTYTYYIYRTVKRYHTR